MATPHVPIANRLSSIDAYRGSVMFLMMAEVLHLQQMARAFPDSEVWKFLARHQTHVEWAGCTLHDLIQPSFSFLVGVALPFSIASRQAKGHSFGRMFFHAVWRAVLLVALGVFLRSTHHRQTMFTFEDTLSQIGLGYVFLFLLGCTRIWWQVLALVAILAGYWGAFYWYPLPPADFDYAAVGVPADWAAIHNYTDAIQAHWNKNSNLAWGFDVWFLNLLPRENPFTHNGGGYATLSFIPTLGTMVLGLIAGSWLKSEPSAFRKVLYLILAGGVTLAAGFALDKYGLCPSVKRIWTPAWVLYSGGFCYLILAGFYLLVDLLPGRILAFPLIVIGMNSIAIYCLVHLIGGFLEQSIRIHLRPEFFTLYGLVGEVWTPIVTGVTVLVIYWLILFWMYRQKVFVRI